MSGRLKLQIASDIHREFGHNPGIPDAGGDVLVLAGDIGHADESTVEWIHTDLAERFERVLYVPGNHEFYGKNLREADAYMAAMQEYGGYEWLNNRAVEVGGQRFVGTPLWANFCRDPWSMLQAGGAINDFDKIRYGAEVLNPGDMLDLHEEAVAFLSSEVRPGDVVITHWPPTQQASQGSRYPWDALSMYFYADIPEVIAATKPVLWIFGHTHHNVDFSFGDTRILSNQGGYPHERESAGGAAGYNPWLVVEVGPEREC